MNELNKINLLKSVLFPAIFPDCNCYPQEYKRHQKLEDLTEDAHTVGEWGTITGRKLCVCFYSLHLQYFGTFSNVEVFQLLYSTLAVSCVIEFLAGILSC